MLGSLRSSRLLWKKKSLIGLIKNVKLVLYVSSRRRQEGMKSNYQSPAQLPRFSFKKIKLKLLSHSLLSFTKEPFCFTASITQIIGKPILQFIMSPRCISMRKLGALRWKWVGSLLAVKHVLSLGSACRQPQGKYFQTQAFSPFDQLYK